MMKQTPEGGFRRDSILLDGEWEFAPDDEGIGLAERWYQTEPPFLKKITVPGCWEAQGYHCHTAWYRRTVLVPMEWQGKQVWLMFGGVSYVTDVWINGQHVLNHEGLLMPFQQEISAFLAYGEANRIVVRVAEFDYPGIFQSEQLGDKLLGVYGCWTTWGGIYQSVKLEATSAVRIDNLFLIPDIERGLVVARVRLVNNTADTHDLTISADIRPGQGEDKHHQSMRMTLPAKTERVGDLPVSLHDVVPWRPDNPFLYQAQVTLLEHGLAIDRVSDRFGMRKVEVEGKQILLNGQPIFLRGWLCDAVYPEQISPTLSEQDARRILSLCKEYGFNFVRHHTHPAPPIFHEIADELGVLQLEEFASHGSIGNPRVDPTQETRQQIHTTWRQMIERDRNHPSLIIYGVNNECWNKFELLAWAPIYRDLYHLGKELDPTRLIVDNSGGEDRWSVAGDIYDKHLYMFPTEKEMEQASQERTRKYIPKREAYFNVDLSTVDKPCLVTEVGGWSTFPDFERIRAKNGGQIPWWLSRDPIRNPRLGHEVIARMEREMAKAGLAKLYPIIVANSERYAEMGNKLQMEHLRQTPGIAGYAYCTFNDCYNWTCGLVDNYWEPKSHARDFALHNQASVLLWPRQRWCFWIGEELNVPLVISHYGQQPIRNGRLSWKLTQNSEVLLQGSQKRIEVACYQVQDLVSIALTLPRLPKPAKLCLQAMLEDENHSLRNYWNLWAFEQVHLDPGSQVVALYDPDGSQLKIRGAFSFIKPIAEEEIPQVDVLLTTRLTDKAIRYLEEGGKMLWLERGEELNCRPYTLQPAVDYRATLVRDHPLVASFPHEGWCDMQFHNLIGRAVVDTGYFEADKLAPIMETFHVPFGTLRPRLLAFRRKGFLVEAQVGEGRLLATTFVFDGLRDQPEVQAMAARLIGYLLSPSDKPVYSLSSDELREWAWGSVHGEVKLDFVEYSM